MRVNRWHRTRIGGLVGAATLVALSFVVSCSTSSSPRAEPPALLTGGRVAEGRQAMIVHGCGSCHRIPDVPNANSLVGPPLDGWSRRSFIAGTLPNTQENLERWLRDPQAIRPGSAMPTIELTEQELADMTAFLFTRD